MPQFRRTAVIVAAAATLAVSACSAPPQNAAAPPATTTAAPAGPPVLLTNCGLPVSLSHPAQRAVAVNQPAVELLLSLGLGDRMVGYATTDNKVLPQLEAEKAKVRSFDAEFPSFEAVLEREPDLVYTTFDYTFSSQGIADRKRFTDLGIATYQSPSECGGQDADRDHALTLDDMYAEIGEVSSLFGVADRGRALVDDLQRRATAAAPNDGAAGHGVSMAWWYSSTKTPYIAGCCGAPGLMTRAVGATNAFEDSKQYWPETGWESIVDRNPDVLVLADLSRGEDGDSAQAKIKFLESDPVASKLTAVREHRYIILDGTTMDPSIRNVDGIEQLAAGLRKLGLTS